MLYTFRNTSSGVLNKLIAPLSTRRTIVNVYKNKQNKENEILMEEGKIEELFKSLQRENEMLDEKYRYSTQTHGVEFVSEGDATIPTNDLHYDQANTGFVDEAIKKQIYADENIPKDKNGIPLHLTPDPKLMFNSCAMLSLKNYTPVDSKKYTHSYIQHKNVIFEDGVRIEMKPDEFVRNKLKPFLTPAQYELIISKKMTQFKNGGRGAPLQRGSERYRDKRLNFIQIQEIQSIKKNFQTEFKDEIEYYKNNCKENPDLKEPKIDYAAVAKKYNMPVKAIITVMNSRPVEKYTPEQLAQRMKKDEMRQKEKEIRLKEKEQQNRID